MSLSTNHTGTAAPAALGRNDEDYRRQIESRMTSYGELVDALELTVAEQSERLAHSRKNESLLAALVESTDDAVIGIGLDLKVMFWNRAAEQLLGYGAAEAIGQDPAALYIPPDTRAEVRQEIVKDFEALKHQQLEVVRRLEAPIMRRGGATFEASVTACGIRDAQGKLLGMSVVIVDISERKRIEREQALLAAIVESSDDAIVSLAPDLTITSWNKGAEKLLGFTAAEAVGQPTSIYIPPELREQGEIFLRDLLGKLDRINSFEAPCLRKDGSRVDTWTVTFGIRDREGHLVGMSAIHRDITERKRAERERTALATIVNGSDDAIIAINRNLKVISWNAAAQRDYGFSAEEAIGRGLDLFVPTEELPQTIEGSQRVLKTGESISWEQHARHKDGTEFVASVHIFPIRDERGEIRGVAGIGRDITERKRAEREQALLAALVKSSDDVILSLSTDFRVITWNQAAVRMFGFTAEEAVGQRISDLTLPPPARDTADAIMRHDLPAFRENSGFVRHAEDIAQRKDGSRLEVWITASGIYDASGELLGVSSIIRDITERKRAERERETMASIVNASADVIVARDREDKIVVWNPAAEKVYGLTAAQAYGHGLELFVSPQELERARETDMRILRTGETFSYEHHPGLKYGHPEVSLVSVFPIRDAAGNITGVGGIARDITKLKQAEKELRAAQEYTRGLIESSIDAMVVVDRELRISDCNEQLARLTRIPKRILIGSRFDGYFEEPARAAAAIEKTLSDGFVTNYDLVMRPAGGLEVHVSFNASIFYSGGKVFGIFGVARDVTEERATKRVLEAERRYSRSLFDSSTSALLVCNDELVLTDVNRRAIDLTGYSREELKGIRLAALFTDPARATESAKTLLSGEAGAGSPHEFAILTKDAREIPVSLRASFYQDVDAAPRGILVSLNDITENKQYQEQRSLLASIVDSSADAIYTEAPDFTITSWNAAAEKLFGYRAGEILGRNASVLVPLERRAELMAALERMRSTGKGERFETTRLRKDRSTIEIDLTLSPLTDASGKLRAFALTAHDIGERKRLEAEVTAARDAALEAARLKSEFLANMSHEIRTPLNSVIGMTGLLLDSSLSVEQREYANDVRESADALLTLINDILDFSKIAAGKLVLEDIDFELTRTVENTVEMIAENARSKGLELIVSIEPDVPQFLHGDPGRLRQILLNLLSNAVKFTAHGEVGLQVSKLTENPRETLLRFEVRDTGIGIPRDKIHLLFQPFTQVDASTTRHFGGTGLGLSIVKQLVERMGGDIAVTSTPDVGSTFWFTVCFGKQVDKSRPASERFALLNGVGVLIVDDNENSRHMLSMQTSAWGMKAVTAGSAEEALRMMRQAAAARRPFTVALLDVMMPDVDGIELARLIKSDPALAAAAIIFVSSIGPTDQVRARLRGLEYNDWLMKPVPQSSLYNSLIKAFPPVAADEGPKEGDVQPANGAQITLRSGRKPRILVAEDNPLNQKLARLQLGKLGMEVDAVGNGREAVDTVMRIPYDAVLMDCQMPEMDGYEATREIRRREGAARHTQIVAMTAHALEGDREKCLAAGMDAYVSKPVRAEVLEATLKQIIGNGSGAAAEAAPAVASLPASHGNGAPHQNGAAAPSFDAKTLAALRDDGLLDELIELFESDTPGALERLAAAFTLKDFKSFAGEAHRLKGSAAALGAQPIFELCQQLQSIASVEELEKAQPLFARLQREAERALRVLPAERGQTAPSGADHQA